MRSMTEEEAPAPAPPQLRTLREFLEEAAPGILEMVDAEAKHKLSGSPMGGSVGYWTIEWPPVFLFCKSPECDGLRFFDARDASDSMAQLDGSWSHKLLFRSYTCRHCKVNRKVYATDVRARLDSSGEVEVKIMKFGENPPAIGPTPRALQDLLGEHWSLYLQGRRSELAGLGIGAFVYYRRAVEKIWQTALARLIEIAQLEMAADRVQALQAAQQESEFTRSMNLAKGSIPGILYVDGHNPFQALYDACGDGLHEYSDEECISRARMIRLVLGRFSERAKSVLSEDAEFRAAVGAIAGKTQPSTT
jgi:hypothetical protein